MLCLLTAQADPCTSHSQQNDWESTAFLCRSLQTLGTDVFPSSPRSSPLCFGFKVKLSHTQGPRESRTWEMAAETQRARAYYQKEFECSQQPSSKLESFGSQEWVVLFVPAHCSCSSLSLPTPLLWVVYYTQATNEWEPLFYSTPHLQDLSLGLPQIWLINSRAPPS